MRQYPRSQHLSTISALTARASHGAPQYTGCKIASSVSSCCWIPRRRCRSTFPRPTIDVPRGSCLSPWSMSLLTSSAPYTAMPSKRLQKKSPRVILSYARSTLFCPSRLSGLTKQRMLHWRQVGSPTVGSLANGALSLGGEDCRHLPGHADQRTGSGFSLHSALPRLLPDSWRHICYL